MPVDFVCSCGRESYLPDEFLGKRVQCNFCGALSTVGAPTPAPAPADPEVLDWEAHVAETLLSGPDHANGSSTTGVLEAEPAVDATATSDEVPSGEADAEADEPALGSRAVTVAEEPDRRVENPKEYKVLSQRDKWFGGRFDPARLEEAINFFAQQGWVVKSMAAGAIGLGTNRDELVVLLERG